MFCPSMFYFQQLKCGVVSGLRKVYPYPFKFNSHAKGRWLDRKLIDVLSSDFDAYDIDYYVRKFREWNLFV